MNLTRVLRGEEGAELAISAAQDVADHRLQELLDLNDASNQKLFQRASALYLGAEFRLQSTILAVKGP